MDIAFGRFDSARLLSLECLDRTFPSKKT